MKILKIFKRKPSELDKLVIDFFNGGINNFAEKQAKEQQEHYWRLKEVERRNGIIEKYEYLKAKNERIDLSDSDQKEYDYVKFLAERYETK